MEFGSTIEESTLEQSQEGSYKEKTPHSFESEKGIICSILINSDNFEVTDQANLTPEDFYITKHQILYRTMQGLRIDGSPINTITMLDRLEKSNNLQIVGGAKVFASYETHLPTAAFLQEYVKIVKEKSTLRKLIRSATDIIRHAQSENRKVDEILDDAEQNILKIRSAISSNDIISINALVHETVRRFEMLYNGKCQTTGISSGFQDFDQITSGLQPGELIVVAARPSMGKTAFTLNIAANIALYNKIPVAFFSLEMGAEQLVQRLLGSEAEIDLSALKRGQVSKDAFNNLIKMAGHLAESPLYIDETASLSIAEMRSKCRKMVTQNKVQLIIVDYLQLMTGPEGYESKAVEVAEISKGLKGIARELKVPVIALSQLNRGVESRTDKRPMMSDLRESGAIEQDADVIAFLYREEYYLRDKTPEDKIGIAEVIVAKNRNGPTGMLELRFAGNITRFQNLDRRYENFAG